MNFGNFLLGLTEGFDRGVEAGDRISAAMDKKAGRDAAKKTAQGQKLRDQAIKTGMERVPSGNLGADIAAQNRDNLANTPAPSLDFAPAEAKAPAPAAAPAERRPSLLPTYEPPAPAAAAARVGVEPPAQVAAQFPPGIASGLGVLGRPEDPYRPY